ncbi:MAG: hypothetical protein ACXVGH_14615, partial [Mycobacteriales bacterium]
LSTRPREADDEIADLVGMSAEQFFQVVLLPQGDFAQFLRASSVDRAAVLQRLFGTERFADVESWLAGRRRTTAEELSAARSEVGRVVAALAEVAQDPAPESDELGWAQALLTAAQQTAHEAAARVAAATSVRDAHRSASEAAVRLAGLQGRRRAALLRRDELAAAAPSRVALQAELDAAARAATVAPALADLASRRQARDGALAAEAVARAGLAGAGLDVELPAEGLRAAVASGRERAGRLEALRAVDAARLTAVAEAAHARDELADALAASAAGELLLAALPGRREQAQRRLAEARAAQEQVPVLSAARERLVALRPDLVELGRVTQRLGALAEEHLSARETALSLAEKAADLRAASVNSMIARLAFALEDDTPCPVCGSLAHPDPSLLQDEGVSSDDEERARLAAEAAQAAVAEVEARLAANRATAAALRARVEGLALGDVDAQVGALDVDLALLRSTAQQAGPAEADLAALEAEHVEATSALVAAEERAAAASRRASS